MRVHGNTKEERDDFFAGQESTTEDEGDSSVDKHDDAPRRNATKSKRVKTKPQKSSDGSHTPKRRRRGSNELHVSLRQRSPERSSHTSDTEDSQEPPQMNQLFKHIKFFIVPTRAKSNIWKAKARRYEEYGAGISTSFEPSVTHLVVDNKWDGPMVMKYLNVPTDFLDRVKVVNEEWPSRCIKEQSLVDTSEGRYQVPGDYPEVKQTTDSKEIETAQSPVARDVGGGSIDLDELDQVIDDHVTKKHARALMSDKEVSESEEEAQPVPREKKKGPWHKFLCVKDDDAETKGPNPNEKVIKIFSRMLEYYEDEGDDFRCQAYRKAISVLRRQKEPIKTAEQAVKLPGLGPRLSGKVEEIYKTGGLKKLDFSLKSERVRTIGLLKRIYGVGPKIARKWYAEGVRTLDDVKKRNDITEHQLVGVEHYDDFLQRMSRREVETHFEIVRKAVEKLDPEIECTCMGSYRRGQDDCGDIDIILTKPGVKIQQLHVTLFLLLQELYEKGFAKHTFGGVESDSTRWMGATALEDGAWRRMDILLVPWEERGASFIYYTGNDIFNRSLRLLASRKGYHLNNKGLFFAPADKSVKGAVGKLVEGQDERKIFEKLGVPYRPPQKRNVG